MKTRHALAALSTALLAASALADVCDGARLDGEVQLVWIDGTDTVSGRMKYIEETLGVGMSPIVAEPQADGTSKLRAYETRIPARMGQVVGELGTFSYAVGEPTCTLIFHRPGAGAKPRFFETLMRTSRGDLILGELPGKLVDGRTEPTLLIKRIRR